MDLNYALEKEEVEAGYILTCQSHPITERAVSYTHLTLPTSDLV